MTLILRIALPCLYVTFFTLFVLSVFLVDTGLPLLTNPIFRMSMLAVYLLFLALIYFTVLRLRRVEYRGASLFVTDYFKNDTFHIEEVTSMKDMNLGIATLVKVKVNRKSRWNKRHFYFLAKGTNYSSFKQYYPTW